MTERRDDESLAKQHALLTRRGLFGLAAATSIIPRAAAANPSPDPSNVPAETVSPVMTTLSGYMKDARDRALPNDVVEKTKAHILDAVAAMISGSQLPPGRAALNFARAYGGKEVSTVVASNILCAPIEASLANAMLAHSDETDDSHPASQSHPGCAVIPAALAVGEQFGISGTHFVRAVALGYDVGTRFTIIAGEKYESESHRSTHSIAPTFGAAAAAACAASLDARLMQFVLGYTAQQCSGLSSWSRDSQHIQKAFVFGGMNARSGVTSALLVHAGWTGVEDLLSGTDNFFEAYEPAADTAGLIEKLGERYEIMRTNIKKWTVGSPIQAALDGVETLRAKRPFTADQVQEVTVRLGTGEARIVNNREMPDICLQHMVAVMLLDKTVTFHSAHDHARMKDPAVLLEREKVHLVPDEELQRLMPLRVAIVTLKFKDGTELTQRVDNVRGTPENPMTRQEIVTKAQDLIAPVMGPAAGKKLIDALNNLESVKNIRELRPLLQHAS
ncbi:MAG: MmgE/PrpD family protein [Acidobacteriota bacterium]|nr:MmgE/PrpD family protein [Acidobacteriota bacterium]